MLTVSLRLQTVPVSPRKYVARIEMIETIEAKSIPERQFKVCRVAQRQRAWLITMRSLVQIQPLHPIYWLMRGRQREQRLAFGSAPEKPLENPSARENRSLAGIFQPKGSGDVSAR